MRSFSMVFNGGFKLANSVNELVNAIPRVANIHIREFANPVESYRQAYDEHQFRSGGDKVPRYEKMREQSSHFVQNFVPPMLDDYRRIYVVMHPWYVGILIDEERLTHALDRLPFAEVREAASVEDALAILNFWYMHTQRPMESVIYQRVPNCPNLPLDVMIPMASIQWFAKSVQLEDNSFPLLYATTSLQLETPTDKNLFVEVDEEALPKTIRHVVYQNGKPIV